MDHTDFWQLLSSYLNESDEDEIKARLGTLLNVDSDKVVDLTEGLICHFDPNCTQRIQNHFKGNTDVQDVVKYLEKFYLPVIIFLGITGNITSILVFILTRLRMLTPVLFLLAIAVVDVGLLTSLLIVWLEKYHKGFYTSEGLCQLTFYVSYVCTYLSVWFLTVLSLERFVVVCVFSCKHQYCSYNKAKATIYGLVVVAGIVNLYRTWTSGVVSAHYGEICSPLPEFLYILTIVSQIETVLGLIIPYSIVAGINLTLLVSIVKQSNFFRQGSPMTNEGVIHASRKMYQLRMTKLTIVVSFLSLFLSLPCHALRLKAMFLTSSTSALLKFSESDYFIQEIFQYAFYTKATVNFFVYIFLVENFRKACKALLIKIKLNYLPCFSPFFHQTALETSLRLESRESGNSSNSKMSEE